MYSAVQQGGRRLYDLARAGQEVPREARSVTIDRLTLIAWEPPFASLEVACSPGTYIRSLAHDLGQALGTGAHLAALQRAASGRFTVEDAVSWDTLQAAMADGSWPRYMLPADLAVADLPLLVMLHGRNGDYTDWVNKGALDRAADVLILAVAHDALRHAGTARVAALAKPGGIVADVKACLDAAVLRAAGLKVWRL